MKCRTLKTKTFTATTAEALDNAANGWLSNAGDRHLVATHLAASQGSFALTIIYTEG